MKDQIINDFRELLENPKQVKQKTMFLEIWNERPHVSELTCKGLLPVGHFQWHWQFLHVLPKGSYPQMKYFKWNILLATTYEHDTQEHFEVFNERKNILRKVYYELIYSKKF